MSKSLVALGPLIALIVGCESASSEPSIEDRQNAALKDPFGYGPAMPAQGGKRATPMPEPEQRDDSLKGDWKRFWNP